MDNIISFSGTIAFIKQEKNKKGAEYFKVRVLQSDNIYRLGSKAIKLEENTSWLNIFIGKGTASLKLLKGNNPKGLFILVKNCKLNIFPYNPKYPEAKFGITTKTDDIIISEYSMPTINSSILEGEILLTNPDTGSQIKLDERPSAWLKKDDIILPLALDDNGNLPSPGRVYILGRFYGKTAAHTQIPHIAAETIIKC